MTNLPSLRIRIVVRGLKKLGFEKVRQKGSHRRYKHRGKSGRVTIAGKSSDDLAPGTLNSILKQAQLKEER